MEFWLKFLPLIIYILLIIFIAVGIVLGIKAIITISKLEKVVDDVTEKVQALNPIFNIIGYTTDKITIFTDKVVDIAGGLLGKLLKKRKKEEE